MNEYNNSLLTLISTKAVVLTNSFVNLPCAGHSGGKNHQISCSKFNWLTLLGGNSHFTFKQQAGFLLCVGPWKGAGLAGPDWPILYAKFVDSAFWARRGNADHYKEIAYFFVEPSA